MEKDNDFRETTDKLKKILWKLLDPHFKTKNDLYLNLLLSHWNGKTGNGALKPSRKQEIDEIFFQWIIATPISWDEKANLPSTPVSSFALNVGCQLSADENFFIRMKDKNVYEKLAEISIANKGLDTGVSVGFITLLSSVLEHTSGVQWLMTTTYWNDVIHTALKGHTKYIRQKAYQFIIKLLESASLVDKDLCEELVEILVEPLSIAAVQVEFTGNSEIECTYVYESLKPTLDLVSEVIDHLLRKLNQNVLNMFLDTEISEAIQNILNFSKTQDFSYDLLKIRFVILFYHLCGKLEIAKKSGHDANTLFDIGVMFDLIKAEIEKDHVGCVIKICYYAHVLYCSLDNGVPLCTRKGELIEFQNQMMLFQLVPVMTLSEQFLGTQKSKQLLLDDVLRQKFYMKLAKISAIKTLEITRRWERRLASKSDLLEDGTLSLQYILKSKKIINKELAAIVFQPLVYSLKDAVNQLEKYRETNMPLREINYFSILVDVIIDLVKSFDLTWKDSIETISVLDLACEIVQHEYADYQVTVKLLQLLNTAISKGMSPDMALLMVNTSDSVISQIGSLLYTKCHNKSYQIRNNALEVVRTLALDAEKKFPEFTNVLFNAELPQLVVNMAVSDSVHGVREKALNCIRALILVEDICEVFQADDSFWNKILNILLNEPKGTVRKEASRLISDLCLLNKFPEGNLLTRLYDVMTHTALSDIHWEVKHNALRFWAYTVENHLIAQGMSDRMFPEYTFLKHKKKIVNLNQEEIRRRVIEALNQLSEIGTIYILKTAFEDEFDKEVSRFGKTVAAHLIPLFTNTKITPDNADLKRPSPSENSEAKVTLANPVSPAFSNNHASDPASPRKHFLLDSSPSQNPSTPSSSDLSDLSSYSHMDSPADNSLSPASYSSPATPYTPKSSYSNQSSPHSVNHAEKEEDPKNLIIEELENINFFETSCNDSDIFISEGDIDLEFALSENMENAVGADSDMAETGKLFDELLKLNDETLMEEICSPGCAVKPQEIKTKQYVPPSEYVKLCLELAEANDKKSKELVHDLDEFNSLLNEVLQEYNLTYQKERE